MTIPHDDHRLLEEAARWLRRLRTRDGAAEQAATRAALRAWLALDERHVAALDLVTRAWEVSGAIDERGPLKPDLARARSLRLADGTARPARAFWRPAWRPLLSWRPVGGLGALAALALLVVALWNGAVSEADYVTLAGERPLVRLADGTVMRLDGDTRAHVRLDPLGRRVVLARGRVDFQVAHEARRPFRVQAAGVEVHDIGTRFTVQVDGVRVRTILLEGAAALHDRASGRELLRLTPGQQVDVEGGGPLLLGHATPAQALAWEEGRVVFDDQPLSQVVAQMGARSGAALVLDDPALAGLRVSGSYRDDDVPAFLTALARLHPIVWRRDANGDYRIARRR